MRSITGNSNHYTDPNVLARAWKNARAWTIGGSGVSDIRRDVNGTKSLDRDLPKQSDDIDVLRPICEYSFSFCSLE